MSTNSFFPITRNRRFKASIASLGLMMSALLYGFSGRDERIPVPMIGVHHLGQDHRIQEFYVDKHGGDNVGQSGDGGRLCCVTIPVKWQPKLQVEIRWKVYHIKESTTQVNRQTAEIEGIYSAIAPVERYVTPGNFYVHFFPGGRVRVVVSEISPNGRHHPIKSNDLTAGRSAIAGKIIGSMFTPKELAEFERNSEREKSKNGDSR